jgi:hypothetical protein
LEVVAGEEEEEEESLEELLKRNKKMNPLSRYIKKGKPKMTIDGVLDIVNDVYDKKAMVDAIDLSQGNSSMTLAEFLDDYFLHKFGLQVQIFILCCCSLLYFYHMYTHDCSL